MVADLVQVFCTYNTTIEFCMVVDTLGSLCMRTKNYAKITENALSVDRKCKQEGPEILEGDFKIITTILCISLLVFYGVN